MSESTSYAFIRRYRLRGELEGAVRTFLLQGGKNSVGRAPDSEVRLAVRGVSNRHAELTVGPGGLRIRDLDSKNGSFVNGARVSSAHLRPGDELWFGSAELTVEEVDLQETELAIDLAPGAEPTPAPAESGETPTRRRWLDGRLVERWLIAIDSLASARGGGDLQSELGRLALLLGVRTAILLEADASGRDAVLLAACGVVEREAMNRLRELLERDASAASTSSRSRFLISSEPGSPPLTVAVRTGPADPPTALAFVGDFRGRAGSEMLLRILLSLFLRLIRDSPAPRAGEATSSGRLIFPPGYVRGVSPAIRALHAQMEPLGQGSLPVLISGETGVGKEYVARILHDSSERSAGPFVAINCAAVPAELLEAELFGIGRGVATGVSGRRGRFLEAQGGTLFLDEIGDLPQALQPKLLRALEEKEIHPLGKAGVPIDVRIIAATNTDLTERLEDGRFRADLYYRLAGVALRIPPLRERRDDISMFVEHFLRQVSAETGKPVRGISVRALRRLVAHTWPGNVRELLHEVRRLVYVCPPGEAIEEPLLAEHLRSGPRGAGRRGESAGAPAAGSIEGWLQATDRLDLQRIECAVLREALRRTDGNQSRAGELLGISRMAVRRRLDRCRSEDGQEP